MQALKTLGVGLLLLIIVMGGSLFAEWPKYKFERAAAEAGRAIPGARLISSTKSGDLASPVSWFRPAVTTWNFAMPDAVMGGRFYLMTMRYEEEPSVLLVDASCDSRALTLYSVDAPKSAYPARDIFGEPVVAPNGQTYRLLDTKAQLPEDWVKAFCDTDWTAERKTMAAARSQQ